MMIFAPQQLESTVWARILFQLLPLWAVKPAFYFTYPPPLLLSQLFLQPPLLLFQLLLQPLWLLSQLLLQQPLNVIKVLLFSFICYYAFVDLINYKIDRDFSL